MASYKILAHYTYDDWLHWEGKWELIEGIAYAMSPMPAAKHQRIAGRLYCDFEGELRKCTSCSPFLPLDYVINDETILQPDILIVCSEIQKKYLDFAPILVVEVLSPSTALKDRHIKFGLYEQQQIKYYLIISPETEEVEVYVLENNKYELKQKGHDFLHSFSFEEGCDVTIDFKEIW